MAVVGNTEEGIININYKVIIKVLIEVHFKVITKRSVISIKSCLVLLALLLKSFTSLYWARKL